MIRRWQRFAVLWSLGMVYFSPVNAQTWDSLMPLIRKRFPTVHPLSTHELADWLADLDRPAPLLLDARAAEEFEVSHLKNARRAAKLSDVEEVHPDNEQPIVVYCSVGYRSSALAEKLQRSGFTKVRNLDGSLFKWANEGRPLFQGNNQTRRVHPYNTQWGKLLEKQDG